MLSLGLIIHLFLKEDEMDSKMTRYWIKTQFYYQDYDVLFGLRMGVEKRRLGLSRPFPSRGGSQRN